MSLGATFKQAREEKGLTVSQVADATRMMVQVVEDLEREDFRRIAAPIYGRGFIKLYAEHLGLDPEPLIRDFMEIYTGSRPPQVVRRPLPELPSTGAEAAQEPEKPVTPAPTPEAPVAAPIAGSPAIPVEPQEPDLFSLAAGRAAAARPTANPARPSDETPPPRARPVASPAASLRAPAGERRPLSAPRLPLRAPRLRHVTQILLRRLPAGWTVQRAATVAGAALVGLLLLALAVHAAHRHHRQSAAPAQPVRHHPVRVPQILPPPAPYFD